jgi:hypothetical protein
LIKQSRKLIEGIKSQEKKRSHQFTWKELLSLSFGKNHPSEYLTESVSKDTLQMQLKLQD